MERYFWEGFNSDGSSIVTMTKENQKPTQMEVLNQIYSKFIPITKEEVLVRQKEGLAKLQINNGNS